MSSFTRHFARTLLIIALLPGAAGAGAAEAQVLAGPAGVGTKTRQTYYTTTRLAAVKTSLSTAVARANMHLILGYDYLWNMITPQTLPRTSRISDASTDWQAVPGQPWKVTDGTYIYPTNDFAAYYRSGLDEHGIFQPVLADKSLLVNTLYPEKGPQWGVDDGFGWENGKEVWTIVSYYNHHHVWYQIRDILSDFRDAYLYTGDARYARAGAIMLDRVADVYPAMDISVYDKNIYRNSHGGSGKGKIIGSIWEPGLVSNFLLDYDAFFPFLQQDDAELIAFLSAKAEQYGLGNLKSSAGGIRKNIEDGIVRQVLPGVKAGSIHGNFGMHQRALAVSAVVMDEPEGYTGEAIEYLFKSGDGGDIMRVLVDVVDRDGHGNESSPSYNSIHRRTLADVADVLQGYDHYKGADLTLHPKYIKMQAAGEPLVNLDMYTPSIGDSGGSGKPTALQESMAGSVNLAGYGYTALRDGTKGIGYDNRRVLWMYYGRNNVPHAHRDALNLGVLAFNLDLSPDLGYPEMARAGWPSRTNWTATTLSHNTVLVDKTPQRDEWVAIPAHYDDTEMVKLIDVAAPKAYPATSMYRRTSAMIRVDAANSYMMDFFRVKGGSNHYFSFHGAEGTVTTSGLNLVKQAAGTYLSEKIAYADPKADNMSGFNYLYNVERDKAPAELFAVDWDISDTWNVLGQGHDPHLRLTMLGATNEVALADGNNPRQDNLSHRYLVVRRTGSKLNSLFTSVIEPYEFNRFVADISLADVTVAMADSTAAATTDDVRAVKVTLTNGRVDYIINALDESVEYIIDGKLIFKGFFGVYAEQNGSAVFTYILDGTKLGPVGAPVEVAAGHLEGTVVDFTRDFSLANQITVELTNAPAALPRDLAGLSIFVETDGERNGDYLIKQAKLDGNLLTLDIGDITLIRKWVDAQDFSQGYIYDIAPGAECRIPLSWTVTGN